MLSQRQNIQRWKLAIALAIAVTIAGCHRGAYRASNLPLEYTAPPVRGVSDLDMSRMSRPTAAADRVQTGDVLEVAISTGLEQGRVPVYMLRVADDGSLTVPLVGPVRLADLALSEADYAIYQASVARGIYRNPNVSVQLKSRRQHRIMVAGAVKRPGVYHLPVTNCDLLSAIVAAGGLLETADTVVDIRQPQQPPPRADEIARLASYPGDTQADAPSGWQELQVDLAETQQHAEMDFALGDGAVITVRERASRTIYVMGKVKRPSQFEMPPDREVHLLDAIAMAGGRTMEFADKVYVMRQLPGEAEPIMIQASIRQAKSDGEANIALAAGDVVSVEETPLTFTMETIGRFIRFGFSSAVPF
jgi:polysaccharide export outer membrane protein